MRLWNNYSKLIEHELNNKNYKYYKIESLLNYHLYWYNHEESQLEYKIKWKDYSSEFSSWKAECKLNYKDLISVFDAQNHWISQKIFKEMMIKWLRDWLLKK